MQVVADTIEQPLTAAEERRHETDLQVNYVRPKEAEADRPGIGPVLSIVENWFFPLNSYKTNLRPLLLFHGQKQWR